MSSGLYIHVSKAAGTIVTAPLYNNAHKNHQINDIPTSAGGHSDDVTTMRLTTDPAPAGVPAPVIALSTEIEQHRFVIADIKTSLNGGVPPTWWYTPINPSAAQLRAHGARVFRNSPQALSNSIFTPLSFNTVRYDTGVILPAFDPFFSIAQPTRLTARASGLYEIVGYGEWSTTATSGNFALFIRLNGMKIIAAQEFNEDTTTSFRWQEVGTQYLMAQNDYVELLGLQFTGSDGFQIINPEFGLELMNPRQATSPPVLFTLAISEAGTGTGTVTSSPGTINCPGVCSNQFVSGQVVQLTATSSFGTFGGWSGDVPVGHEQDNPLSVTMDQNRNITATFAIASTYYTVGFNGPSGTLITFDTTHHFADLGSGQASSDTVGFTQRRMPNNAIVDRIEAELPAALTGSQTLDVKFSRNGVDDNGITLHFDSGTGAYVVATGSVTLSQDDLVAWHATLGGGLTTVQLTHIVFRYKPVSAGDGFFLGRPDYATVGVNTDVGNFASNNATAINARALVPWNLTIDQCTLVADAATGAGTGTSLITDQNDNGVSVGSAVTLSDPNLSTRGTMGASLNSNQNTNFGRGSVGAPANVGVRDMFSYQANSSPLKPFSLFHTGRPLFNHTVGTGTVFLPIFGFSTAGVPAATESSARMRWPTKGTFQYFLALGFADVGTTVTVTLRINGADTALVLTFTGAGTTVQSDTSTTVAVNPGDYVDYKVTRTVGTNTAFSFNGSIAFEATS